VHVGFSQQASITLDCDLILAKEILLKDVDLKTSDEASSDELCEESGFKDKVAACGYKKMEVGLL